MRLNITLRSILLVSILTLLNLNTTKAQSCVDDMIPPVFSSCNADTTFLLSAAACDTTMTFAFPMIIDDCDQIGFEDDFAPAEWTVEQYGVASAMDGEFTNSAPSSISIVGAKGDLTEPFIRQRFDTIKVCKIFPVGGMLSFSWEASLENPELKAVDTFVGFEVDRSWFTQNESAAHLAVSGGISIIGGPINLIIKAGDSICFYVASDNAGQYDSLTISDWVFTQSHVHALSPTPISMTDVDATFTIEVGLNVITWEATDSSGNTSTCSFNVNAFHPIAPQAACKNINLSLDSICETEVIPQMVYSGDTIMGFCQSAFTLEVTDQWGNLIKGNIVNGSHSGQTLQYKLIVEQTGNSCWGTILVEDKYPPQIECHNDTMDCYTFKHDFTPPTVIDNCSSATAILLDELTEPIKCDDDYLKKITQTWYAKDVFGNVSKPCKQTILVRRFPLDNITPPVRDTSIDCRGNFRRLANGAPDPTVSGVPSYQGNSLFPFGDAYCNVFVRYRDLDLQETGCTKKVIRLWTISELHCSGEVFRFFTQNIKIIDTTGPIVSLPRTLLEATTESRSCSANIWLPAAQYSDECHDDNKSIIIRYPGGVLHTNGGLATLPVGRYNVEYEVFDECYNSTSKYLTVHVRDLTAPVAVCHSHSVVGIHNRGYADVLAKEFDDGSFDECALDSMRVKRVLSPDPCGVESDVFGKSIRFCCDDIGKTIMVEFRVWDKSGNHNSCMVSVEVQDKIPPTIICPPNITVDCTFDWDPNHLEIFGDIVGHDSLRKPITIHSDTLNFDGPAFDGVAYDNCPMTVNSTMDTTNIDNCGLGYIMRFFTITDAQGRENYCTQKITFVHKDSFDLSNIVWPSDYHAVDSCDRIDLFDPSVLPDSSAKPIFIMEDECSLVGSSYKDDTVRITIRRDACFKIIRHWKVIDWCQKSGGTFKRWSHDQVLKMTNSIAPEILSACNDTMKCFFNTECIGGSITLSANAMDDCTPENELFWQFRIDLDNDGTWDIFGRDSSSLTDSFPIGTHRIEWQVEDKCGNIDRCDYLFEMRNCKPPNAYCMNGIIATLTPTDTDSNGVPDITQTTIWAKDLDAGSTQVCNNPITFSFSADTTDTHRTYNCDSLCIGNRFDIEIWVTDTVTGNATFCKTFIMIQDTTNVCPACLTGTIKGLIATNQDKAISSVDIQLEGANGLKVKSDKTGLFAFPTMSLGGSYKIVPTMDDDYMHGVSTRDLVAIQKHLLGIAPLKDPYQLIAADVNNSKSVSTRDISELRKLILGRVVKLDKVASWRFVEKAFIFPNPNNPFMTPFPESHVLDPFDHDVDMNFVGIKMGDVNGDIKFNNLGGVKTREDKVFEINVSDIEVKEGNVYEIVFRTSDLQAYEGYQFGLKYNTDLIIVEDLIPNENIEMGMNNFNLTQMHDGVILTSWSSLDLNLDRTLFTLKIRALDDANLSEVLHLSSTQMHAESYGIDGSLQDVQLVIGRDKSVVYNAYFALYQNEPNPFTQQTSIEFHLPNDQDARLTLYDQTGKVIFIKKGHFAKGMNEIIINRNDISAVGTIFYQLDTDGHSATKKMVVIK